MSLVYRSKSKSSPRRPVRLQLEALEDRMLLSADFTGTLADSTGPGAVNILVEDGRLSLRGDYRTNVIEIRQGATLYEFVISAPVTGLSTTVTGVTGDIDIDLGDGNDSVRLIDLRVQGDLRIVSNFRMENVAVEGDTELATNGLIRDYVGFARDFAEIQNSHFLGCLTLETGAADVTINQCTFAEDVDIQTSITGLNILLLIQSSFEGDLCIDTDQEYDTPDNWSAYGLFMLGTYVRGDTDITTGGSTSWWENDYRELGGAIEISNARYDGELDIVVPYDMSAISIQNTNVLHSACIKTEGFLETLDITSSTFHQDLSVEATGDTVHIVETNLVDSTFVGDVCLMVAEQSDDGLVFFHAAPLVNLIGSTFRSCVSLETYDRSDEIRVLGSTFEDDVSMDLYDGRDIIWFENSTFQGDLCLDGGDGDDGYFEHGVNLFANGIDRDSIAPWGMDISVISQRLNTPPPPPDLAGARVIRSSGTLDRFRVTFSEPINPATFTVADVAILGGGLAAWTVRSVVPVANSNNRSFDVNLRGPGTGGYRITLGPDIRDLAGNWMNQDGDAVNGEATQDRFRFDDRTGPRLLSAVPSHGRVRLTFSEAVDVRSFTRADIVFLDTAGKSVGIKALREVPRSSGRAFDLELEAFPKGGYNLTIGPNLTDALGNLMNQDNDGVNGEATQDRFVQKLRDTTAPVVQGITMTRTWFGITIAFAEPLNVSTLTADDVVITDRATGQAVIVESLNLAPNSSDKQFDIRFDAIPGNYDLTVGPKVTDLFANAMSGAYKTSFSLDLMPPQSPFNPNLELRPVLERLLLGIDPIDPHPESEIITDLMERYGDWSNSWRPLPEGEHALLASLPAKRADGRMSSEVLASLLGNYGGGRSTAVLDLVMADVLNEGLSLMRSGRFALEEARRTRTFSE